MATFNHSDFQFCFLNWIAQQHRDVEELIDALSASDSAGERLRHLVEKGVKHFEEYCERRARLAQQNALAFMCPAWCTSFETAFLWIGGCRPSLFIRLVYAVSGSELDDQLTEYLRGERKGNLAEISAQQLNMINALHYKTMKEEEKVCTRMEEIADKPLAVIARGASQVGESSQDVDHAMDAHSLSLAHIIIDADKLRLGTFKELVSILTPLQAVDLLVATKKLHLSMHEWGKRRDHLQSARPAW